MSRMTEQAFVDFDDLISNTVLIAQDLLNDIIIQINTIETFIPEKEYFWNLQLTCLSSDITKFVELTTMMAKVLTNRKNITIPEIKLSHIHLLFVLKGINQAQKKHDSLVLEDLIKYELKDNLTQWKIDLIPQIRRLLNY
jgi:hypothetical protein